MVHNNQHQKIIIKPFQYDDFDNYVKLQLECPWFSAFNDVELTRKSIRAVFNETKDKYFSIFTNPGFDYCGNVSLQKGPTSGNPEIGIQILKAFQNQGFGTAAIKEFCNICFGQYGIARLEVRIDPDNKRSIHVFEKLGAKFVEKKADYIPLLEKLYKETGKTLPDNLDESIGSFHYRLALPLTAGE